MRLFKFILPIALLGGVLVAQDASAQSCSTTPVCAYPSNGYAVTAQSAQGTALVAECWATQAGVWGVEGAAYASGQAGTYGLNTVSGGYGVEGRDDVGWGVYGTTSTGTGIYGNSGTGAGMYGQSQNGSGGGFFSLSHGSGTHGLVGGTSTDAVAGVYGGNSYNSWDTNTPRLGVGVMGEISPQGLGAGIYGKNASTTSGAWAGYFYGAVYVSAGIEVNATCIAGSCSSDERLKKNIQPLTGSLQTVTALRPVTFEWKDIDAAKHHAGIQTGFIAQEVEKVKPEWVGTDDQGFKTINRDTLPMLLVGSIKELKTENDALRQHDKQLEDRIKALESGRPMTSSLGNNGYLGLGAGLLLALGALVFTRRRAVRS